MRAVKRHDLDWMDRRFCAGVDVNVFVFDLWNTRRGPVRPSSPVLRAKIDAAKEICQGCPVTQECLAYGKRTGSVGIFGGEVLTRIRTFRGEKVA